MFLIDANIISEVRKGARCDARVAGWYAGIEDAGLYLSVLVTGEIRRLKVIIPELVELNEIPVDKHVSFELLARRRAIADAAA